MTITTSRMVLSGALALGALAAVGGFTPGVAEAKAASSVSPFVGSYQGTLSEIDGTFSFWHVAIDVAPSGGISGTATYGYYDAPGSVRSGSVGADGTFEIRLSAELNRGSPAHRFTFRGQASLDSSGNLLLALSNGTSPTLFRR